MWTDPVADTNQLPGPIEDRPSRRPLAMTTPATRGRPFEVGNSGRRVGSKNRSALVVAALLEGQGEELMRTAIALAKNGDVPMLRFLLGRIIPRERVIKLDLPHLEFADDAVEALGHILRGVSEGQISPSEAAALATLVNSYREAIDVADLVKRLDSLEATIKGAFAR